MFADVRLHFRWNAQLFHGCVRVVSNHQRTVKHALPDGLLFRHPLIFAVHAKRVVADQPAQQRAHQRKRNQRLFCLRMMIDGKDNQQNNRRRECQRHLRLGSAEKSHADGKQNHPQPAFPASARHQRQMHRTGNRQHQADGNHRFAEERVVPCEVIFAQQHTRNNQPRRERQLAQQRIQVAHEQQQRRHHQRQQDERLHLRGVIASRQQGDEAHEHRRENQRIGGVYGGQARRMERLTVGVILDDTPLKLRRFIIELRLCPVQVDLFHHTPEVTVVHAADVLCRKQLPAAECHANQRNDGDRPLLRHADFTEIRQQSAGRARRAGRQRQFRVLHAQPRHQTAKEHRAGGETHQHHQTAQQERQRLHDQQVNAARQHEGQRQIANRAKQYHQQKRAEHHGCALPPYNGQQQHEERRANQAPAGNGVMVTPENGFQHGMQR